MAGCSGSIGLDDRGNAPAAEGSETKTGSRSRRLKEHGGRISNTGRGLADSVVFDSVDGASARREGAAAGSDPSMPISHLTEPFGFRVLDQYRRCDSPPDCTGRRRGVLPPGSKPDVYRALFPIILLRTRLFRIY